MLKKKFQFFEATGKKIVRSVNLTKRIFISQTVWLHTIHIIRLIRVHTIHITITNKQLETMHNISSDASHRSPYSCDGRVCRFFSGHTTTSETLPARREQRRVWRMCGKSVKTSGRIAQWSDGWVQLRGNLPT